MSNQRVSVAAAKELRERIGATHVVVFAVYEDGEQCVATHGKTQTNAREAAAAGNRLKSAIGWPEHLCQSQPVRRECANCAFWKLDRGVFTATGWTGDGETGDCHLEPRTVFKRGDSLCGSFEPKDGAR